MQGGSGVNVTHASVATPTFTQTKRKCTSTPNAVKVRKGAQGKNSTYLNTVISNNDTDEFASNLDFIAQEIEPLNEYIDISDTDMVFEQQQVNVAADENRNASPSVTIDCISDHMLQNRGKNGNQNCAQSAIELMRVKIGILQEQAAFNKQIQERRNEIEEEKLKILRENVALKNTKFKYHKINHLKYKDIFTNIDENLRCLKDKVEKLVPSYLK